MDNSATDPAAATTSSSDVSSDAPSAAAADVSADFDPRGAVVDNGPATATPAGTDADGTGEDAASTAPLSEVEERIMKVINVMRPAVQADNGDLLFRSFDDESGKVEVELIGACVTCPASTQTLKAGVERIMRDRVPEVTEVVNIGHVVALEDLDGGIGETAVSL